MENESGSGNGKIEFGKIIERLDTHSELLVEIKSTLIDIGKITTSQEVQISLNKRDIDNVGDKVDKHNNAHWQWFILLFGGGGVIGVVLALIGFAKWIK